MNNDGDNLIAGRFRSYYPVVVDVETAGFDPVKDALLEVAVVFLEVNKDGMWSPLETISKHIQPFPGANLDQAALEFTGIDPDHPFRKEIAVSEKEALREIFQTVKRMMKQNGCSRAILVGHNPAFDLSFVNAAASRAGLTRNPFHPFSTFDTATLGGLAYGQTPDGIVPGSQGGRTGVGRGRSAFGPLRCGTHGRAVLQYRQSLAVVQGIEISSNGVGLDLILGTQYLIPSIPELDCTNYRIKYCVPRIIRLHKLSN